jgi:hypothetical protein
MDFSVSKDQIVVALQQCKNAKDFEGRITYSIKGGNPSIFG